MLGNCFTPRRRSHRQSKFTLNNILAVPVWFITGSSAAMPVLFLLGGPKMVFSPHRGARCPDKREIWHGEVRSPVPNFTFITAEMWEYSRQNCQNFEIFWLVFFVTLWNHEVCDNGNAMKQCNFQNNYGTVA